MSELNTGEFEPPSRRACALLGLVVVVLFARVVGFPFVAFDDAELILRNPEVVAPARAPLDLLFTPHVGYVVPVTVTLQAALYALGGGAAWPFHLSALLLHALYVCQLYLLLYALSNRQSTAAFGAALLFAVHPLVVQPLAWAICLKDLLMANLLLLATRAWLRSHTEVQPARRRNALTAVLAGVLAMLAKPSAVLIAVPWLAFAAALRKRNPSRAAGALRPALVLLALGVVIGAASRFMHRASFGDAAASSWTWYLPLEVLGRQLAHVLWPVDLLVMYPSPAEAPSLVLRLLGIGALLAAAAFALRRRPKENLLLGIAVAIYLPTSNVLPFGRVISDSYMYVPLSMLAGIAALYAERLWQWRPTLRPWLSGGTVVLALMLAAGTYQQLPRYRGGDALWGPVLRAYPRFSTAHIYFADELVFRAQPGRAAQAYRRGFAFGYDPGHLLEFGTALTLVGRLADAECVLIEAVAYGSEPGYARFNLALLFAVHGEYRSRHPVIAAAILHELDAQRRAGRLPWPAALAPALEAQLARLRGVSGDAAWPQRNCELLRAAK